ncbi:DNA helicase PIF1, ATP-dependent [Tanacetum coccineum]
MSTFIDKETGKRVDQTIVERLIAMFNESSAVAKEFRMARDWCHSHDSVNFELRLLSDRSASRKHAGSKRISDLHPSNMAVQYPLLFPYGEDGFHERYLTITIRRRAPYQQYLVDAYTTDEEHKLKWTRNNQDTMRVDLYHNKYDAITKGDTNAASLGKRIVLPISFMGGPTYMMQNYQDAMDLCQAYGNLDLFITFTSNPKWPEIAEMLAFIPRSKAHDRLKIGARVLKMKLTELLDDLITIGL